MDTITVLLVEDNPSDAFLIREYFAGEYKSCYVIEEVETLAAALEVLSKRDIDVVLLDLSLPDSTGLDTVRTVITCYPHVVIVILTGLQDEQVALQSVRYGAQDYLEKRQITPILLHRSISYAIERKRTLREKDRLLADLTKALEQIETLQGILPICAGCKKIRDPEGIWISIERYTKEHSPTKLIHGVCPDCEAELSGAEIKLLGAVS